MFKKVGKMGKFALTPIVSFYKDRGFRMRTLYSHYSDLFKIDNDMVLYESYHGKNATCNPYAMFLELYNDEKYKNFKHVWALNEKDGETAKLLKEYNNVIIIKRETPEYLKYLSKAKYLINNTSFPTYFIKKEKQIYINTWHGTPLKTIGADSKESGISDHGNIQRNFLHVDYLVSPNKFTYEKILEANRINGLFNGKIIDAGYPRVDLTHKANPRKVKEKLGLNKEKKIILFAPTWRDWDKGKETEAVERVYNLFKQIKEEYKDEYEVVLKVHYFVYKFFKEEGLEKYCIPDWVDTNELLSCVDVLITDYSSIFFEYLHTKKPVLFFMYDKEEYIERRGAYIDFEELPGPICENVNSIVEKIKEIDVFQKEYKNKYEKMIEKYCYFDDGMATKRVIETIFENKSEEYVTEVKEKEKTKVLIWGSALATNGITMSFINLMNNIDYTKYDVTVLFASKLNESTIANVKKINPEARVLFRKGSINYKVSEFYSHKLLIHFGLEKDWVKKILPEKLYKRELKRLTGNSEFDIAIDYCGYTPLWTLMLSLGDFKKKNIYLHSDMVADSNKVINGKLRHKNNFKVIFNLYHKFDNIVCVSKDGLVINKNKLKKYKLENKFVNVNNALDYNKVINKSETAEIKKIDEKNYLINEYKNNDGVISLHGIELPKKENVNFITVGRLSPEKDHEKLIKAFEKVNKTNPNTKLFVVGDGVLKQSLIKLVNELNLNESVILTGELEYPFKLVKESDCFVMSSNYEGQGLAILEAMVLNKAVISTDIPGPSGILENGYGMLVENSIDGLAEGMIKYIKEKPTYKTFDYEEYNKDAMESFYKEVVSKKDA